MDEKFKECIYDSADVILRFYNENVKKQLELERDAKKKNKHMSMNEVTAIIQEIIEEELSEINHTTDSSGKCNNCSRCSWFRNKICYGKSRYH